MVERSKSPAVAPAHREVPSDAHRELGRLTYRAQDGARCEFALRPTIAIGRHASNDLQLLDLEVSKTHLVIRETATGYRIQDLGSANGTLLNGVRVDTATLRDGDVLVVGNTEIEVHLAPPVHMDGAQQTKQGAPLRRREATRVTWLPEQAQGLDCTSVFALPMTEQFDAAQAIEDEHVLRRDYERLRVAFDLSRAVGLETDLHRLGQTLLGRVLDVLPADTAVLIALDDGGNLLNLASYSESQEAEVAIPKAIIEQVLHTRDALLTSDALVDRTLRSSHTVVGRQIRSALCVPLLVGIEVYGAIYLASSATTDAYEERDLALLRAIATPAALAVANARLVERIERDARMRTQLSRFLSPALVERVVKRDLALETTGERVRCTVLFADIRDFTALSDGVEPEAVVSMLNEYFESMVELIFMHGGVLDKFLGDGLMAVWGTPVSSPNDAAAAVRSALRMREVLATVVNSARTRRGEAPLAAGFGIATGPVVAGAMGATRRQDFTVIGDVVNLASRLCAQASAGQVLACAQTRAAAAPAGLSFQELPPRRIKGVARPVPVFELIGGRR